MDDLDEIEVRVTASMGMTYSAGWTDGRMEARISKKDWDEVMLRIRANDTEGHKGGLIEAARIANDHVNIWHGLGQRERDAERIRDAILAKIIEPKPERLINEVARESGPPHGGKRRSNRFDLNPDPNWFA